VFILVVVISTMLLLDVGTVGAGACLPHAQHVASRYRHGHAVLFNALSCLPSDGSEHERTPDEE
jgi:hypothetical protein